MHITCPIYERAHGRGGDPAVIWDGGMWTYSGLDNMVTAGMRALERKGVTLGARVALLGPPRPGYTAVLAALWRLGAVTLPLNERFPGETVNEILKELDIRFLVTSIPAPAYEKYSRVIDWNELLEAPKLPEGKLETPRLNLEREATVILTSGSTAAGKAVVHTYGNHYYSALGSNENIPLEPGNRWLLSLPLCHVGGLGILFRCFLAGAAAVLPGAGAALEETLVNRKITHLSLVPTQLARLVAGARAGTYDFSKLKALLLGGGSFPRELIGEARDLGLPVYTTYGLSETASQVTTMPPGAPQEKRFTSGKILKHRRLKIGGDGAQEICVKGKTLFKGYITGTKISRPLDAEGWFHTGDLGRLDEAGYLEVLGRKDNMFISGGENIVPEEIENCLSTCPGVEQAVVLPVPHREYGSRPAAFLRLTADFEEKKMLELLRAKLPGFKIPDVFYDWPEDEAPGLKVKRRDFRERLKHPGNLKVLARYRGEPEPPSPPGEGEPSSR